MRRLTVFVGLILCLAVISAEAQPMLHNEGFDADINYWFTYHENITSGNLTPGTATWDSKYGGSARLYENGTPGNVGMAAPTSGSFYPGDTAWVDVVFEASAPATTFSLYLGDLWDDGQEASLLSPAPGTYRVQIIANKLYPKGSFYAFKITSWPGEATCWVTRARASIAEGGRKSSAPVRQTLRVNPSPTTDRVSVSLSVPQPCRGRLAVYDVAGNLIRELQDRRFLASEHTAAWNGRDENGHLVSPGTYFVRLTTDGGRDETAEAVVVR